MSSGGSQGAKPSINVTPLIDVLLVLLIIFMVITPMKPHRFEAQVPAEPDPDQQQIVKPNQLSLVVAITKDDQITLNNDQIANITDTTPLVERLKQIFQERANNGAFKAGTNEIEKTLFVKAPRSVKYGKVVNVIDAVKQAGAQPIGLQIDDLSE